MKLSVYVPRDLEPRLHKRSTAAGVSPALYVQALVKEHFEETPKRFSEAFARLAGSWEDDRCADEILRDIHDSRRNSGRPELL